MTFGIKVVFREDFEEANKGIPNPEEWSAETCWVFLTEAGQPMEFQTEIAAREFASCNPPASTDQTSVYAEAPLAWKLVGFADCTEAAWRV